jgi:hypothetical protein
MELQAMPALATSTRVVPSSDLHGEIVEIALLLPKNRAEALMNLSRQTHQSVGQILRGMIERVLSEAK